MNQHEPVIVINGMALTKAQAMTVRVAIASFLTEMSGESPLGGDPHGIAMAEAYAARCGEVLRLMAAQHKAVSL